MLAALLLVGLIARGRPANAAPAVRPAPLAPASATLLGASVIPDAAPSDPASAAIAESGFEQLIGRKLDIDRHHYSWAAAFPGTLEAADGQQGRIPMITWDGTTLDDITAGSQDALITVRAEGIKALGVPVFLSFGARMNDGANAWSGLANNDPGQTNGPQKFVAAWQHVHDLFAAAGAANAAWVWTPASDGTPVDSWNRWSAYYPGDAYVDWVGINGYNWGTVRAPFTWTSFGSIVRGIYGAYAAIKPIMVETGSVASGGKLTDWLRDVQTSIKSTFPAITALVYSDPIPNTLTSTRGALTAFRGMALDPRFNLLSAGAAPGSPFPMTDVTTLGARGDGVTDSTDELRQALAGGNKLVYVPAGDYVVSGQLDVRSYTTLWFASGATLLSRIQDWQGQSMLDLHGVNDVTVVGGILDGRKDENPTGYLYGLSIWGDPNLRVRVHATVVRDMPAADATGGNGGDGFYLGSGTDIRFESVVADGNVRQGLSITGSAQNVLIADSIFANTSGSNPGAGLDIEPNPGPYAIRNIQIVRSQFLANNWGVVATLANSPQATLSGLHIDNSVIRGNRRDGGSFTSYSSVMDDVSMTGDVIQGNGLTGVYIIGSVRVGLSYSQILDNGWHGVMLERDTIGETITGNTIMRNGIYGIYILNSTNYRLRSNTISLNGRSATWTEKTT